MRNHREKYKCEAIPESGRLHEFRIDLINSVEDCDEALSWLEEQRSNMQGQIANRRAKGTLDPEWAAKVGLAMQRAKDGRVAVERKRGGLRRAEVLARQRETERAFMDAAAKVLEPSEVSRIWKEVHRRWEELDQAQVQGRG